MTEREQQAKLFQDAAGITALQEQVAALTARLSAAEAERDAANNRHRAMSELASLRGIRLEEIREALLDGASWSCVFGEDESENGSPQILDGVKAVCERMVAVESSLFAIVAVLDGVGVERERVCPKCHATTDSEALSSCHPDGDDCPGCNLKLGPLSPAERVKTLADNHEQICSALGLHPDTTQEQVLEAIGKYRHEARDYPNLAARIETLEGLLRECLNHLQSTHGGFSPGCGTCNFITKIAATLAAAEGKHV